MKCSNVVFLTMISGMAAMGAKAGNYSTPMDNTIWQVESSIFACKLTQPIPHFGSATFIDEAGLPLMLQIESPVLKKQADTITVFSAPAPWHPFGANIEHASNPVQDQAYRHEPGATELLDKMSNGQWAQLDILANTQLKHRITLTSVGIADVIEPFSECRKTLLPVNFEQIKHTIVYYDSGQQGYRKDHHLLLQDMIAYILADPRVNRIEIDGHTDGIGDSLANRTLSMERSDTIRSLMLKRGITSSKITTRYHGDRYPIGSNNTVEGRAKNRRVEIRLYRDEKPKLAPKATETAIKEPPTLSMTKEENTLAQNTDDSETLEDAPAATSPEEE